MKYYLSILVSCLLVTNNANCQLIDSIYSINSYNYWPITPISNYITKNQISSIEIQSFSYNVENGDTIMDLDLKALNLSYVNKFHFNAKGLAIFNTVEIQDIEREPEVDTTTIFKYDDLGRLVEIENLRIQQKSIEWFSYPNQTNQWIRKNYAIKFLGNYNHLHSFSLTYKEKSSIFDSTSFYWCNEDSIKCVHTFDHKKQSEFIVYEIQKGNEFHSPKKGKLILKKKNAAKEVLYFDHNNKLIKRVSDLRKKGLEQEFYYNEYGTLEKMTESFIVGSTETVVEHFYSYHFL